MPEDKRMRVRFPYTHPASYMVMGSFISPPGIVDIQGEILDISDEGVRIRVDGHALKPGTILRIRVPLYTKFKPNIQVTLPVLAEVKWVRNVLPKDRQAGLRFVI